MKTLVLRVTDEAGNLIAEGRLASRPDARFRRYDMGKPLAVDPRWRFEEVEVEDDDSQSMVEATAAPSLAASASDAR